MARLNPAGASAQPDDPGLAFSHSAVSRSRFDWFVGTTGASSHDDGSLTYEPYCGLREKPFGLSSDPRFFFSKSSHGAAFDKLAAGIRRREGILALTGEVGTGKTTLCRAVLQSLDERTFATIVPDPFLSREDLLKRLLIDFGIVSAESVRSGRLHSASRTDLSYPLYDFLASLQPLHAFAVVVIDEAQNLTSELLEEIRILSDLEDRQKLLEVLLVGQPELRTRLTTSAMRQLSQRITTRLELSPLQLGEVQAYVSHRLMVAGNNGRVQFTEAAIGHVFSASSGIPRVINLVCDRALLRAVGAETTTVDADHVLWAVDDLKLLAGARPLAQRSENQVGTDAAVEDWVPDPEASTQDASSPGSRQVFEEGGQTISEEGAPEPGRRRRTRLLTLAVAGLVLAAGLGTYWLRKGPTSSPSPPLAERTRPTQDVSATADRGGPSPEISAGGALPAAASPAPDREPGKPQVQEVAPGFAIQMATFQTSGRAVQALQQFLDAGYRGWSTRVELRDGGQAFGVFLGPYENHSAAELDLDKARQIPGFNGGRVIQITPSVQPPTQP
jgi:general secretion pathway protein A